ncbi:MAG: TRAP transporter small permease [Desulfohalobiaceae bacterium]|nr:TRAP transporter small permease [Desulfohalobiaceae bacterium]
MDSLIFRIMDRSVNWFLALLMSGMVVVITAQVWYRFVLNDPLAWSEEMGRYLFVWISFMGAAAGVRYQVHLGIDLMQAFLGPRAYKTVVFLVNVLIQIFLLVIIYWGFKILLVIKFQTSPSMHIPMIYPYLAVPVGCLFMFVNSVRIAWTTLLGKPLDREVVL